MNHGDSKRGNNLKIVINITTHLVKIVNRNIFYHKNFCSASLSTSLTGVDDCSSSFCLFLVECAKILLGQPNIEVDAQNKLGDTPLHNAAWKGHVTIVEMLLEKGQEIC